MNQQLDCFNPAYSAAPKKPGKGSHVAEGAHKRYFVRSVMHAIGTTVMALAIVLAVALVGVRFIGYDVYAVLSGSMEPTYHTGSVIYVKDCEPEEVRIGDPITFVVNEDLVVATHRVIAIDEENGSFTTKGDANEDPDGAPVLFENLIGKPVFSVPYLGYIADYVQEPPGAYVAVAVCALIIMLTFIPDLFSKEEDEEKSSKKKGKRAKGGESPDFDMPPYGQAPMYPQSQCYYPPVQPRAQMAYSPQSVDTRRAQRLYNVPSVYDQSPDGRPRMQMAPCHPSANAPSSAPYSRASAQHRSAYVDRQGRPIQQDWGRCSLDDDSRDVGRWR